jgi:hypothetical protein
MAKYESEVSNPGLGDVFHAARSLQKAMVQVREKHPDLPQFGIGVKEPEKNEYGGPTGTTARIRITIDTDTVEGSAQIATIFENAGCFCTSSGATEVTCNCD